MAKSGARKSTGIRERGENVWELRVFAGRDPVTGKERTATRTFRGNFREAVKARAAFLVEVGRGGGHRSGNSLTFREVAERWYRVASPGWSPSGQDRQRGILDGSVYPLLGDRPLGKVTTFELDGIYAELRERGDRRSGGGPLAAATVARIHVVVRRVFEQAVEWELIDRNPASRASPGTVMRADLHPPTRDEAAAIVAEASRNRPALARFLTVAAYTGARRGELCALRWSDVDFGAAELHIGRAMSLKQGAAPVERQTKTGNRRRVPLAAPAVDAFGAQWAEAEANALTCGILLPTDGFVFSDTVDGAVPWRPDRVSLAFRRITRRLGLTVRLHDLRHAFVTELLGAGVDLTTVAHLAGHAGGGATTLAVYSHYQEARGRAAVQLLETS